jgi:hypothetical protein
MPPDDKCESNDKKSKVKLIGACIDLPPGDFEKALNALKKILDDKKFQKDIEKVFREESKKLLKQEYSRQLEGGIELPDQETGKRMLNTSQKAFKTLAEKEFKKSHAGRRFKKDVDRLSEDFNKSPVGVWVDKNTNKAYIIVAVALIGGGYGIYKTKRDKAGLPLELIDVEKKLGAIKLSGEIVSFKPGSGEYGANVGLKHNLQQVKYDLKLTGLVSKNGDISQTAGLNVVINVDKKLTVTTSAKSVYSRKKEESTRMVAGYTQSSQFNRTLLTADAAIKVEYKDNGYKFQAVASMKGVNMYDSHSGPSSRTISVTAKASKSLPRYVLDGASVSVETSVEHSAQSGSIGAVMFGLGTSF